MLMRGRLPVFSKNGRMEQVLNAMVNRSDTKFIHVAARQDPLKGWVSDLTDSGENVPLYPDGTPGLPVIRKPVS